MCSRARTSPAATVLAALFVGYAYGWVTSSVPAPQDPEEFWVANLSAPYLVLPFLTVAWAAARHSLSSGRSALLGAATGGMMIAGFYGLHRVGRESSADSGLADGIAGAYGRWFSTFLLGRPGGIPWLTIGIVTGVVAGLLAWSWSARRLRAIAVVVVGTLLLEPVARLTLGARDLPMLHGYPRTPPNVTVWLCEATVGVAALVLLRRRPGWRQPERRCSH